MRQAVYLTVIIVLCASTALGGEVNIKHVTLLRTLRGWALDVQIEHEDINWRHFANWIQVETAHEDRTKETDSTRHCSTDEKG